MAVEKQDYDNSQLPESAEHLLASYERERQPVARLNAKLSVENFEKTPHFYSLVCEFDFPLYRIAQVKSL